MEALTSTSLPVAFVMHRNTGKLKNGKTFGIKHLQKGKEDVPGPQYAIGCSTLGIAAHDKVHRKDLAVSQVLL